MAITPRDEADAANIGMIWKNAGWLGVVPILLNFVALFSTGYITRRVGPEQFGRFNLSFSLITLTLIVTDLGLRALAVRDLARGGRGARHELNDLLSLRLMMALLAMMLAWLLAAGASWLGKPSLAHVMLISSFGILPTALTGTLTDGLIARDKARITSVSTFWSGTLLTVASVIAVAISPTELALATSYLVGPIVNMAMLARSSRTLYGPARLRWRPRQWRVLVRRAIPFYRISIVGVVLGRIELPLIAALFGDRMVGYYSAAMSLADRLSAVIDSVTTAALPTLMRLGGDAKRITSVLARIMYPLLGALLAGAVMASTGTTAAVSVVFGAEYAAGGPALAVGLFILPMNAMNALIFEGFVALRRVDFVAGTILRGQIVNGVLLLILVPSIGIIGGPVAKLLSGMTIALSRVEASRKAFPGLWSRVYLGPLSRRTLWALPVPFLVLFGHFRPLVTVLVAGGAFLVWVAATARTSGVLALLRPRAAP
ncbi:MAG: oligosaccharide flippase family protein [Gemmatimonadota bacterium]